MTATPQMILDYLTTHATASALELSRALGMTPANIRHHTERLLEQGAIERAPSPREPHRGRPTHAFRLGPARRNQNLDRLVDALLLELVEDLPNELQEAALRQVARRLAPVEEPLSQNLTRRLSEAIHRLNELAYHARWEAHAEGPWIFLHHCPYAAVIKEHAGALCRMDACIIEELTGQRVRRKSGDGELPCVYQVGPATAEGNLGITSRS